jgi:hypothetical protein
LGSIKSGSLPVYAFALFFRNESSYTLLKFPYNGNPPCERLPAWQVTGKFCEGETLWPNRSWHAQQPFGWLTTQH